MSTSDVNIFFQKELKFSPNINEKLKLNVCIIKLKNLLCKFSNIIYLTMPKF